MPSNDEDAIGIMEVCLAAFLILLVLKLAGAIAVSWFIVTSVIWGPLCIFVIGALLAMVIGIFCK